MNEMIVNLAKGDYFAFARFYDDYYTKVYRFARYFTHSDEVCKEIISDFFFGIWTHREQLTGIQNLDGYFFKTIRNLVIKYNQSRNKFDFDSLEEVSPDGLIELESPEQMIISDEIAKLIETSVQSLPNKCKTVFLLVREEGLKYREVAELLSISERTVQNHMVTAVKKIISSIRETLPEIDTPKAFMLFVTFFEKKAKKLKTD